MIAVWHTSDKKIEFHRPRMCCCSCLLGHQLTSTIYVTFGMYDKRVGMCRDLENLFRDRHQCSTVSISKERSRIKALCYLTLTKQHRDFRLTIYFSHVAVYWPCTMNTTNFRKSINTF